MNRERAKELLPVIQAFAEGKDIEYSGPAGITWDVCTVADGAGLSFSDSMQYRVRQQPAYRPFTAEEAKGQVGKAVVNTASGFTYLILASDQVAFQIYPGDVDFGDAVAYYTFLDGRPVGVEVQS